MFPEEGGIAKLNSLLAKAAADHGERAAVRMDDLVLTYSQLRDAARPRGVPAGVCRGSAG